MDVRQAAGERAIFRTRTAWGVDGITHDPGNLERGFHVVVITFEGDLTAVRMRHVARHDATAETWQGCHGLRHGGDASGQAPASGGMGPEGSWSSSLDREAYKAAVCSVREDIAAGTVYQANICRVLSRASHDDMDRLFLDVLDGNPAPYACRLDVEGHLDIVSASPELYLARDGRHLSSAPIKGTAPTLDAMLAKDATENIMITDLVRNDLQRVCEPGTVEVDGLLRPERHPGLVHLVSTVRGHLRSGMTWENIVDATFPPGSVSGAPKSSALDVIRQLEVGERGPYCGAIGWIDADARTAELAVGIRTFWRTGGEGKGSVDVGETLGSDVLHFGAGAGITWDSDPRAEWNETELKARRLLAIADGRRTSGRDDEHPNLG